MKMSYAPKPSTLFPSLTSSLTPQHETGKPAASIGIAPRPFEQWTLEDKGRAVAAFTKAHSPF